MNVNLFIASSLDWAERGIRIVQTTEFPKEQTTKLVLAMENPTELELAIRIPAWCSAGFMLKLNKELIEPKIENGYAKIHRQWQNNDVLEVALPFTFRKYPMPDKPSQMAFLYGPLVLVGEGARQELSELVGEPENLAAWFKPIEGEPLHFTATDDAGRVIHFKPYYEVGAGEFFTGYWDVVEKASPPRRNNIALGQKTTSSTPDPIGVNVEAFMRSAKAVDGQHGGATDFYTKWFPNGLAPQWLTVDLGEAKNITGTEWFPALEDIESKTVYRFIIESSSDGENWQIFQDQSENQKAAASYACEKTANARFMKLTILPFSGYQGNQARPKIAEFMVFGD